MLTSHRDDARERARAEAGPTDGELLRSLDAVVANLALSAAVERMAVVIGDAAERALAASRVVVALLEHDGRRLRPVHAVGVGPRALHRLLTGLADDALLAGAGLGEGDALVAQRVATGARDLGMVVLARAADRPFSAQDRAFLHVLAGVFALAVERGRLADRSGDGRAALQDLEPGVGRRQPYGLEIDLARQQISLEGRVVRLTPSELRLLLFLAEEPGRPRSRREILRHLSGDDGVGHERACDVHVSNLRRKIEKDPSRPARLVTLRGVGYALNGVPVRQVAAGARRT